MLEMFTIEPGRASRCMRLTASRVQWKVPLTFTAITRWKPSSLMWTSCWPVFISFSKPSPGARSMPALFTSTSTRAQAASMLSKQRATPGPSETSQAKAACPRPPSKASVSLAAFSRTSSRASFAPSRAKASATARPMPEPAPVTTAIRPASRTSAAEPLAEEAEHALECGARRMAGLVDEMRRHHRVRAPRDPVRVAAARVDLDRLEGGAELAAQRLEARARHHRVRGETHPEHGAARRRALLHAREIGVGEVDRGAMRGGERQGERGLREHGGHHRLVDHPAK